MTGKDCDGVLEREQFIPDSGDQQIDVAAGQITAANAAGEKNIATKEQPVLARKETKTAWAMARHFQNLEVGPEKTSVWCFFDEKIWFDWFDLEREPEVAKEIAIRDHGRGERVTSDLGVKLAFNPGNVLDVIDVPVCQQ